MATGDDCTPRSLDDLAVPETSFRGIFRSRASVVGEAHAHDSFGQIVML